MFAKPVHAQSSVDLESRLKALETKVLKAHLKCVKTENVSPLSNHHQIGPSRDGVPPTFQLASVGCRVDPWHQNQPPLWLEAAPNQCYIKSSPNVTVTAVATWCGVSFD